jgi:hypothetical protein
VAALVTGVLVVAGVLFAQSLAPTPPTSPTDPAPPTSPATVVPALPEADRALLAALSGGLAADTCASDPDRPASVVASVRCTAGPGGLPGSARFQRFTDAASLDKVVADEAEDRGLPLDTGKCEEGADVQTTWERDGKIVGLLVCYSELDGARTILWTNHSALALGAVTRTDGDAVALYDWWTRYDFG